MKQVQTQVKYKGCMDEVVALIKARAPIIWVVTHEEQRFIKEFEQTINKKLKRDLWTWSSYQGLVKYKDTDEVIQAQGEDAKTNNPQRALQRVIELINKTNNRSLCFLLKDFHTVLIEPVPRQIRDMYDFLAGTGGSLVILSPLLAHGPGGRERGLPSTLEKQICVVEYELPTFEVIKQRIETTLEQMKLNIQDGKSKYQLDYTDTEIIEFSKALQGLTILEIETAIATSFTHLYKLDVEKLLQDKRQIIRKSQILEFIDEPVSMDDIGGLNQAKNYLAKYAKANTDEARKYGVEPLKGILLVGIPGCGKSLLTKAVRAMWKLPLLQLDVGKVMGSLVGQSEGKMREVIQQAEACAPCLLLIDEVEKGLAGTKSSNMTDGGTLARVFGTLLTAMQDRLYGVTVIATANSIELLPPEFIRRFNEVFFVDLPGPEERWEVFTIHLNKRGRDIKNFEQFKDKLLEASMNYTGAEIEKAIKDAIAAAFYDNHKDLSHKDLLQALKDTKPISKVMADKIKKIRDKAKGQYRFASSWSEQQLSGNKVASEKGKTLDVNKTCDDLNEFVKSSKKKTKTKNRFEELE